MTNSKIKLKVVLDKFATLRGWQDWAEYEKFVEEGKCAHPESEKLFFLSLKDMATMAYKAGRKYGK